MDPIENKQYSYRFILTYILLSIFFSISLQSQEKNIEIKSAGSFDRNESLFPDGNILSESNTKKVHLRHDEMDIFSKNSIFFQKRNSFIATGSVHVMQGDSINLFCDSLNYDGLTKKFSSYGSVRFINDEMELNSSVLFFDRNINGWVTTPPNLKLPKDQQDRDMIARELLIKFQMSSNHPLVTLKKAYKKN